MDENKILEQSFLEIDHEDREALQKQYTSKLVYEALQLTRETLRYYEKLGLIEPIRTDNQYRNFDTHTMYRLMAIDYYKKRGFQTAEIPEILTEFDITKVQHKFELKRHDIQSQINQLQFMLDKLVTDEDLLRRIPNERFEFKIQDFPRYRSLDRLSYMAEFDAYQEHFAKYKDNHGLDMFSDMIREVFVDPHIGYQRSLIHIVERTDEVHEGEEYLYTGPCIYTIVESRGAGDQVMKKMFHLVDDYLNKNHLHMIGSAYIIPRMVFIQDTNQSVIYHETYIPFEHN